MPLTGGRSKTLPLAPAPSHEQGHGKIQLNEVLFINVPSVNTSSNNKLWLRDNQPLSNAGVVRYAFTAVANSRGKVTLAWTDPAASPLADVALVNDLDLVRRYTRTSFIIACLISPSTALTRRPQVVVRNGGFARGNAPLFSSYGGRDFLNNQVTCRSA